MSLYENWVRKAYTKDGKTIKRVWDEYLIQEQKVYEDIIANKKDNMQLTVLQLAEQYDISIEYATGFLDGINDVLPEQIDFEEFDENTVVDLSLDFEKLYKKMVEYKAEHLYSLPEWNNVFTEEQQVEFYNQEKSSRTVVKDKKVGRNETCPCGSGKKYKFCCGVNA